jgi:hypothetical protein
MIDDLTLQEALARAIRIQQQMFVEFEYIRRDQAALVKVLSSLDPEFAAFFFSMKTLDRDPGWNKERIPTWAELEQALRSIGWVPDMSIDVDWGNSHAWFKHDPWDPASHERRQMMTEKARKKLKLSKWRVANALRNPD